MACLGCGRWSLAPGGREGLCDSCLVGLRRAPARLAGDSDCPVTVHPGFIHDGAAKQLVHHLKYRGIAEAAKCMAGLLLPHLPTSAAWVPIPRAAWRRLTYGVDAAEALAVSLSRLTGAPVVRGLGAAPFHRPHAGKTRAARSAPVFWARGVLEPGVVLVDDVLTSGSTLAAAALACGVDVAVTFTAAPSRIYRDARLPLASPPK